MAFSPPPSEESDVDVGRSGLRSLLLLVGVSGDSHLDLVDSGFPIDRNELIVVHAQGDFRRQTLHVDVYGVAFCASSSSFLKSDSLTSVTK